MRRRPKTRVLALILAAVTLISTLPQIPITLAAETTETTHKI